MLCSLSHYCSRGGLPGTANTLAWHWIPSYIVRHTSRIREELGLKYKKMYWLVRRKSALSIHNKLMLYKQILKAVWTYGIQMWGCTKQSNIGIIQWFQNKVLRNIVDASWYIRNADLHRDLQMEMVTNEIGKFARIMKKGISTTSKLKRSSCSTAVN